MEENSHTHTHTHTRARAHTHKLTHTHTHTHTTHIYTHTYIHTHNFLGVNFLGGNFPGDFPRRIFPRIPDKYANSEIDAYRAFVIKRAPDRNDDGGTGQKVTLWLLPCKLYV